MTLSRQAMMSVVTKSTAHLEKLLNAHTDELTEEMVEFIEDELDKRSYDEPPADSPSLEDTHVMPSYGS